MALEIGRVPGNNSIEDPISLSEGKPGNFSRNTSEYSLITIMFSIFNSVYFLSTMAFRNPLHPRFTNFVALIAEVICIFI